MKRRVRLDKRNAGERLASIPTPEKRRVKVCLRQLGEDATGIAHGVDVKELRLPQGSPRTFRARIGVWRIVFVVREKEVIVLRIFPRSEGYRWMEK